MPTVYPIVPGHEIVGRVTKVGSAVSKFKSGDLAAVGCLVDSDGTCPECRSGFEQFCPNLTLTFNSPDKHLGGVTYGGYSDNIVVDERKAQYLQERCAVDPPDISAKVSAQYPGRSGDLRCARRTAMRQHIPPAFHELCSQETVLRPPSAGAALVVATSTCVDIRYWHFRPKECKVRGRRVLLGDDHALVLSGIGSLLQSHYEVVGTAPDGRQLVEAAARLKPDFVVLDVSMPVLNGLEAAKQIKNSLPSAKLIVLSMHANPMYLRKAFDMGASAYVLKAGLVEELLDAMQAVSRGDTYVSPGFGQDVLQSLWNRSGKPSRQGEELTDRQREILQLIAEGQLSKQIADTLGISIKTVEFHRGRIMARLGVHSIAELVRVAVEQGLIPAAHPGF